MSAGTLPSCAKLRLTAFLKRVTPISISSTILLLLVTRTLKLSFVLPMNVGSKLPSGSPNVVCVSPVLRLVTSTVLPGGTDPSVPPTLINWLLPDLSATARISPVGAKLPPSPLPPSQARNTAPKILNKKTVNKILIFKSSLF